MTNHYTEAERLLQSTRDGVEEDDEIGAAQVHAMLAVVDELTRVPNPTPNNDVRTRLDVADVIYHEVRAGKHGDAVAAAEALLHDFHIIPKGTNHE